MHNPSASSKPTNLTSYILLETIYFRFEISPLHGSLPLSFTQIILFHKKVWDGNILENISTGREYVSISHFNTIKTHSGEISNFHWCKIKSYGHIWIEIKAKVVKTRILLISGNIFVFSVFSLNWINLVSEILTDHIQWVCGKRPPIFFWRYLVAT